MSSLPPNILFLLVIILVPTIPSFLMFKYLPANAVVKGPFKGLRIDLSGGFGGYFLIFLVLAGLQGRFQSINYEKWEVNGQIVFPDSSNIIYVDPRYVTLSAPSLRSDSNGNFTMSFLRTPDGQFDYPHLYINFPGYEIKTFWLGPKEKNIRNESLPVSFDKASRVIDLGTIRLVKATVLSNAGNGAAGSQSSPYKEQ